MENFKKFLQHYAKRTNSPFMEYSPTHFIITCQISDDRKQQVSAYFVERDGAKIVEFISKVVDTEQLPNIDYKKILSYNQEWCSYSRFVLYGGMLQAAASAHYDFLTEAQMEVMLREVAEVADKLEEELTGSDFH